MAETQKDRSKKKKAEKNRIPYETVSEEGVVSRWTIPAMGDSGKVVRRAAKKEEEKQQKDEIIEDYKGRIKPRPLTADQLKQMVDDAQQEGYGEGYGEGLNKGNIEGQAKGLKAGTEKAYQETKAGLEQERMRLSAISDALMAPMNAQDAALEKMVVDMAFQFAKQLIHTEIQQSPDILSDLVNKVLTALPVGAKNISVHLNADDAELLESTVPREHREWHVKTDKALASGGCRVETLESLVDYDIDARIAAFRQQVIDNEVTPDGE